jgi:hypothetical protein
VICLHLNSLFVTTTKGKYFCTSNRLDNTGFHLLNRFSLNWTVFKSHFIIWLPKAWLYPIAEQVCRKTGFCYSYPRFMSDVDSLSIPTYHRTNRNWIRLKCLCLIAEKGPTSVPVLASYLTIRLLEWKMKDTTVFFFCVCVCVCVCNGLEYWYSPEGDCA